MNYGINAGLKWPSKEKKTNFAHQINNKKEVLSNDDQQNFNPYKSTTDRILLLSERKRRLENGRE